jgi:hypothetical protein
MMLDHLFWLKFWMIVFISVTILGVSVVWYGDRVNQLRFSAWNECLSSGGEPKDTAIIGSNEITFTCEKQP